MHTILDQIVQAKKQELDALRRGIDQTRYARGNRPVRDFRRAVSRGSETRLIAEIKFASPSAGVLRHNEDPVDLAVRYEKAGAAAISLITERLFFRGRLEELPRVSDAVSIPVLMKDFILDELQVEQARGLGADAVLLIARILSLEEMACLLERCKELGMAALVEVHDSMELGRALAAGAEIIGVNNRDLDSFDVDLGVVEKLAPMVPETVTLVSESGVRSVEDFERLSRLGVQAVLAGTVLMKSSDPGEAAAGMVMAGRRRLKSCVM